MSKNPPPVMDAADTQLVYARVLERVTRLGFLALAASFAAYLLGWLPPHVPVERLPAIWNHTVADYLRATGMPSGWSWVSRLGEGDVVTLVGIAILATAPMLALAAAVPLYAGVRADRAHVAICVAELAVLVLAASAVLGGGH